MQQLVVWSIEFMDTKNTYIEKNTDMTLLIMFATDSRGHTTNIRVN